MNTIQLKREMRAFAVKHGVRLPRLNYRSRVWGVGARRLAWRVSSHKLGRSKATTRRKLIWRMFHPETFAQAVARIAKAEVGVKEHPPGSNSGPRVDQYLRNAGIPTSLPAKDKAWCGAGAKWVEDQAARQLGKTIRWFPNPAWVPNWTAAFGGKLFTAVAFNDACGGDKVTLWGSGHIETVIRREGNYLICVGFNTTPTGQNANGGMVARTKRHRSEVTKIGRRR